MLCRFCHFEFFVTFFDFIFVDCSHGKPANICNNMRINFMVFDVRQINTSSQGRVIMVIGLCFMMRSNGAISLDEKYFLK